jgi:hypothetical protein
MGLWFVATPKPRVTSSMIASVSVASLSASCTRGSSPGARSARSRTRSKPLVATVTASIPRCPCRVRNRGVGMRMTRSTWPPRSASTPATWSLKKMNSSAATPGRPGREVVGVGGQPHAVADRVVDDHEGAGAVEGGVGVVGAGAEHHRVVVAQVVQEEGVDLAQREGHLQRAGRLDAGDVRVEVAVGSSSSGSRSRSKVQTTSSAVSGLPSWKRDALDEVEGVAQAVVGDRPPVGEPRLDALSASTSTR